LPRPAPSTLATLAVVPVIGRSDLAARSLNGTPLIDIAIATASAACSQVLVVSPTADAWVAPRPIDWLIPHSDADFLDHIAAFDRILIHDLLCPLTPSQFLRDMAASDAPAVAAISAVTDTLKAMDGDVVSHTMDRELLRVVASPVVADREVLALVPGVVEALRDLAVLVARLRALTDVLLATAPFGARRVSDEEDLRVLGLRRLA
jgi:hypothetical protein